MKFHGTWNVKVEVGRKLVLEFLEYRVLGGGLDPPRPQLRRCSRECRRYAVDVLKADPKGLDQFLDEAVSVWSDLGVDDCRQSIKMGGGLKYFFNWEHKAKVPVINKYRDTQTVSLGPLPQLLPPCLMPSNGGIQDISIYSFF